MPVNLLKELVIRIAGKNTEDIVTLLYNKKNVNEFKLADKLKVNINQARNILYSLHANDIVSFIRKKDKRKGWYIYYWTLDTIKSLQLLHKIKMKQLRDLEQQRKSRQIKIFYTCPNKCMELSEENAIYYDFTCPECSSLLQPSGSSAEKEIDKLIKKVENEIQEIEEKLNVLLKKEEKKKEKKERKDAELRRRKRKRAMKKAKKKRAEKKSSAKKKIKKRKPAKKKVKKKLKKRKKR